MADSSGPFDPHAFAATPTKGGVDRQVGWAGRCDKCDRGPNDAIHACGEAASRVALLEAIDLGPDSIEVQLSGGRIFTIQRPDGADRQEFADLVCDAAKSDDPQTIMQVVYTRWGGPRG